ncbi:MAG TPA: hypothetical protein VJM81_05935 [Rhizorhapis sp.]|nr:hypothetical protein [Rhizorhapis sp.]
MRLILPSLMLLAALGGCVAPKSPPPPAPKPAPARPPAPAAAAPLGADWRNWPMTPGDWSYVQDANGPAASFGRPAMQPDFAVRCDRARRRITLSRAGTLGTAAQLRVRTSFGDAAWAAQTTASSPPYVVAELDAMDPALDRMAFSRGRFVVEVSGLPFLALPPWAEFIRVIEDCRG